MKRSLAKAWVADLRSGRFVQTEGVLHSVAGVGRSRSERAGYCCLGVLSTRICRLKAVKETGWKWTGEEWSHPDGRSEDSNIPLAIQAAIGLSEEEHDTLASLNDAGETFKQLANRIERKFIGKARP